VVLYIFWYDLLFISQFFICTILILKCSCALILSETLALYKSFTYLLTCVHICQCAGVLATFLVSLYYVVYIASSLAHRVSFMVFFLGAIFCMGSSAAYHVFICHSEITCKLLAKYGLLLSVVIRFC